MHRLRRAALGLGLAGVGHLLFPTLFFTLSGGLDDLLFNGTFAAVGVGLLVASGGLANLDAHPTRGPRLLAAGLLFAAVTSVPLTLMALGSSGFGLYFIGFILIAGGLVQGAWLAWLWTSEEPSAAPRRAAALRVSLVAPAFGAFTWLALNLSQPGDATFVVASLPTTLGFVLAAKYLEAPPQAAPALPVPATPGLAEGAPRRG